MLAIATGDAAALAELRRAAAGARQKIAAAEREAALSGFARFRKFEQDPVGFVMGDGGLGEHLWSTQRRIMESVRDNRRTAVPSCHGSGKSHLASRIGAWWICSHPLDEVFLVTSAPTEPQLRAIFWRYMNNVHQIHSLPGTMNQKEWVTPTGLVAFGRKPADQNMTGFQGIHARYVLVIFDEACGMSATLWDAASSLMTGPDCRILAIGNPDNASSAFADVCQPASGWNVIPIDAYETPLFTGEWVPEKLRHVLVSPEWVEQAKADWGEDSPIFKAKVRGMFPDDSEDGLIKGSWVKRALAAGEAADATGPVQLGVDVAREGGDATVIVVRRGVTANVAYCHIGNDIPTVVENVVRIARETGATKIRVDDTGVGGGVTDYLKRELKGVVGVNFGAAPAKYSAPAHARARWQQTNNYANIKMQMFWHLRLLFEHGEIALLPGSEAQTMARELTQLRYFVATNGALQMEAKKDMKKRLGSSPDRADALALAFADIVDPPTNGIVFL